MTDYLLWYYDIENRFSPTSLTDTTDGDGYIATAVISAVTTNSSWKMSLYDAYEDLRQILIDGEEGVIAELTTTQRDALSEVMTNISIFNITTQECQIYTGTYWLNVSGEKGGLVHLPASTITTTDNTQTAVSTVTLDEGSAYLFTAEILGETTDLGIIAGLIIECTAKRVTGGSAVIVGGTSTTHTGKDSGAASWGVTFTVSGNDLLVSVTGGNATTVDWECDLNYLKY